MSHTFLFLVKPSQNSFHQKDGNNFFWHQKEDWKIHHQPYEPLKSAKTMIGRKNIYISVSLLIKKIKMCSNHYKLSGSRWGGMGVLPHMAYTGMCHRTGSVFLPLCPKQGI